MYCSCCSVCFDTLLRLGKTSEKSYDRILAWSLRPLTVISAGTSTVHSSMPEMDKSMTRMVLPPSAQGEVLIGQSGPKHWWMVDHL